MKLTSLQIKCTIFEICKNAVDLHLVTCNNNRKMNAQRWHITVIIANNNLPNFPWDSLHENMRHVFVIAGKYWLIIRIIESTCYHHDSQRLKDIFNP